MNIIEAIDKRKSIRSFKPDPVPKDILVKVMEAAIRAPSWANTQPWEFAILGGKVIEEFRAAMQVRSVEDAPSEPDIPRPEFPEAYLERISEQGSLMLEHAGIARSDEERRRANSEKGRRFFDAPHGIVIHIDRSLNAWSIFDSGMAAQTLMLAALEYGLGTIPELRAVDQPDVLRRILGLPESKLIVVGIAIGYPDWDHPVNNYRTPREPLEKVVTWHGF